MFNNVFSHIYIGHIYRDRCLNDIHLSNRSYSNISHIIPTYMLACMLILFLPYFTVFIYNFSFLVMIEYK